MGIQNLNDVDLLKATKTVVQREREILIEVLHHLREIDRRRLYSALKYRSLYDYATKELGYSEDQAYRRINAMRMIREMPAIEQKVGDGRISLSALAAASSVIKAEAKQAHKENGAAPSLERKLELVNAVEGLSRREAEGVLQKITGLELNTTETIRAKGDALEIKMTVSPELHEKLEKLKGWLAHSSPNLSTSELIEKLCDDAIAAHGKKLVQKTAPPRNIALALRNPGLRRKMQLATQGPRPLEESL